jgi:filamentous hemagglutinin family protein
MDGKLGAAGALSGPDYAIGAGLGSLRGNNLFHSFSQLDLKAGETATFSGPANVQNILGRVTGGAPSSIDGTIRSGIAGANLFLINPKGIIFGPNAAVDVAGSFAASSANYLRLANGARFVAALDADDSVLTTDPVVAFGFLEGAAGAVEVRGAWSAAPGGSLSAIGSPVTVLEGARLDAPGGVIRIAGSAGPGEVPATSSAGTAVSGQAAAARALAGPPEAKIVIRGGKLVVDNAQIQAATSGGAIDIVMTDGVQVLRGGQVTTSAAGEVRGGNIEIQAPSVLIDGEDGAAPTRIAAETFSETASAAGGDILIRAETVELRRGAEISVSTFGVADAGRAVIEAGTLRLAGSDLPQFPTQIAANAAPMIGTQTGAGGGVEVRAGSVEISNGAAIMASTMGDANAGSVAITAGTLDLRNGAVTTFAAGAGDGGEIRLRGGAITLDGPFASVTALTTGVNGDLPAGDGGVIDIQVDSLRLQNDAGISATTYGDGLGGTIRIAADSVVLDTASFQPGAIPGITAASQPPFFGESIGGRGGDIEIAAGKLSVNGGMTISTTTSTAAEAGSIRIRAQTIALDGASTIQSASTAMGTAGTVTLDAAGDVRLAGGSSVSTSAPESSGGDISIRSGGEFHVYGSRVTAQAGPGGGGNVGLSGSSLVYLKDGTLTAQAVGDGGNLTLEPDFFVMNRGSLVSKSTSANGGNISVFSDYFLVSESVIDASAPFGLPGTVSVSAPNVDLSGVLVALPGTLLGVETLLQPDCGVRLNGNISSFIVLGRGGLPLEPGGFVPSATTALPDEKP